MAVLGFIGLCGVLAQSSGGKNPGWMQFLVGGLVLLALGLACAATVLVGLAAWPIYGPVVATEGSPETVARTSGQLRMGISLTFVSVVILALATSSKWWPTGTGSQSAQVAVEVTTEAGVICGNLTGSGGRGLLTVSVGDRLVAIALTDVVSMQPVDGCT